MEGNLPDDGVQHKKEESREPLIHGLPSGCGGRI